MNQPSPTTPAFDSPYAHGFVRAAICTPRVTVADPDANAAEIVRLAREAVEAGSRLVLFPELSLSGYSCDDLFHQDALLDGVERGLASVAASTASHDAIVAVGGPLRAGGLVFNTAVLLHRGGVLGVIPKTHLPTYREYYEKRHFAAAGEAAFGSIELFGQEIPFGNDLVFDAAGIDGLSLGVEICEDLWAPVSPSARLATGGGGGGATVILNLSASNAAVGKADHRELLCRGQSLKLCAAYLYGAAGEGESTTDLAWDGQALACELGATLVRSGRYMADAGLITADIDLERIRAERTRTTNFRDGPRTEPVRRIGFEIAPPAGKLRLNRPVERFPYVPHDEARLDELCEEAHAIQVAGLAQRLRASKIEKVVIGVSGGLDSTHALVVCCDCFDRLGRPREDILAYSMPGFATTDGSKSRGERLCRALGASFEEIDIRPSCEQMLSDLGHPYAAGEPVYDITFENVQAGERTNHLFRLANHLGGLVIGTGDLSELALGFCTYGVGDQMSHYAVNCSVPKTLIQHLIRWTSASGRFGGDASRVLDEIAAAAFSPELIPEGEHGEQTAESVVGPYELQDFNLFYTLRYGMRPSKIAYLAQHAWGDAAEGPWPSTVPAENRRAYTLGEITANLEIFIKRFFAFSQFKRSAIPNGPKVSSGGSLSPRGDWRAPSDASAEVWLRELREHVPAAGG